MAAVPRRPARPAPGHLPAGCSPLGGRCGWSPGRPLGNGYMEIIRFSFILRDPVAAPIDTDVACRAPAPRNPQD